MKARFAGAGALSALPGLMAGALLAGSTIAAGEGLQAVGSWIVTSGADPGTGTERHAAATPSSRGGGMLGFRCVAGEPSVVLEPAGGARPRPGERLAVSVQIGATARAARATVSEDATLTFEPEEARFIIGAASGAAVFSFRWRDPSGAETVLVFRPALTRTAVSPLAKACDIPP